MTPFPDALASAEAIITMIVTGVGAIYAAIAFFERRARRRADALKEQIVDLNEGDRQRLGKVEREVMRLDERVTDLDTRMGAGFEHLNGRVQEIERTLETVARRTDIEQLRVQGARVDARLDGLLENDRQLLAMLQAQGGNISDLAKHVMGDRHGLD